MGIYLKDTIEGTCRKAINDERGNNILETYQKKLGIGEFIGNIDLISKNSVCLCWSIKCEGTFPLDNMVCILKTENYEEAGDTQAFVFQTALPVDGENEGRCFIRKKDLVGDEVSASDWHEIPSDATINKFEINFDSEDDENPVAWTSMRKIVSGKIKDLFGNVSIMAKNIRWLYKMLGTTNIASIGGGTLTGAVSKLNTDLVVAKAWKTSAVSFMACTGETSGITVESFLDRVVSEAVASNTAHGDSFQSIVGAVEGPIFCALTVIHSTKKYYGGFAFTYSSRYQAAQFFCEGGLYGIRFP